MRIEIINKNGDLITDFESESNPFKIGEAINISVSNYDESFWSVDEVKADFKVEKIEHFLRKDYTLAHKCYTVFTVSVEVSELL